RRRAQDDLERGGLLQEQGRRGVEGVLGGSQAQAHDPRRRDQGRRGINPTDAALCRGGSRTAPTKGGCRRKEEARKGLLFFVSGPRFCNFLPCLPNFSW